MEIEYDETATVLIVSGSGDRHRLYPTLFCANALKTKPSHKINPTGFERPYNLPLMTQTQPIIITTARVDAYFASALGMLAWLFGVMLRLPRTGRSARLSRLLSWAERAVECVLFLKAVALYGPLPRRRRQPRFAPRGFRRKPGNPRSFMRSAGIRAQRGAGVLARVMALIDALAHPQSAVAYFLKQICAGLRGSALVAVAPPAHALESIALIASRASYDSS